MLWQARWGGGSYLDVHETNGILDKTWQEIYNAFASGIEVRMIYEWTESGKSGIAREFVESIGIGDDQTPYMVFCGGPYAAQKPSDYPVHQE